MKPCEFFLRRGKNISLELLTTCRHLKCGPCLNTLLFVRCQKPNKLETTGLIFKNLLHFRSTYLSKSTSTTDFIGN